MDRYGRRHSITDFELDLISPNAGFGHHNLRELGPPPPPPTLDQKKPLIPREEENATRSTRISRLWELFHGGWRTSVALGCLGAAIVLTINVCLLIWIKAKYHVPNDGAATVFEGSCSKKTTISVWCHLAINVCSTLLLCASNNAMQVLSAPTRADVDRAHARGFWMDVGIPSVKNLRIVGWRRVTLWAIVGLSSIPLHLFYNSMISTTLSTTDFMAIVTRNDFLQGAAWNHSVNSYVQPGAKIQQGGPSNYDVISNIQANTSSSFRRLDITPCINTYNHEFVSDWRNVLLISNASNTTDLSYDSGNSGSVLQVVFIATTDETESPTWFCGLTKIETPGLTDDCTTAGLASSGKWPLEVLNTSSGTPAALQYCMAEKIEPQCKVTFNVFMLFIAVICNAAKVAAFLLILLLPGFKPLITVGDAIASFLTYPDAVTARIGAPAIGQDGSWKPPILSTPWKPQRCHYFCGATLRQWIIGVISIICIFIPAIVLLVLNMGTNEYNAESKSLSALWKEGFGAVHVDYLVKIASTEIGTALVANSPQLLLSTIYVSYNLLLTSMMMTAEYNDFAVTRKALRVSEPKGQQRSSYYLQLPYRYAVPLVICSGTLHWLVSQSLFQVQIIFFSDAGVLDPSRDLTACGWSPIAVVFALFLGSFMILALCVMGCRKLHKGMPVMRSNSLDIGAACHPPHLREDMALKPVSYGAADVKGFRSWYACFTDEKVVPLTRRYDGTFRLDLIGDAGDELDLMLPTNGKSSGVESIGYKTREMRHTLRESF